MLGHIVFFLVFLVFSFLFDVFSLFDSYDAMARTKQTHRLTDDEIIELYIAPLLKVHIYFCLLEWQR